ncbi:MAG: SAM-dependent methyltransferase [Pseudomonadota bacterium]
MGKVSAQADSVTMSGGGVYSLATKGAKDVIDAATPMVVDAINAIPAESFEQGFTFSDMGCADGGTSLSMVEAAINAVRARRPDTPVSVVYTDQPRNDFNALVTNVHGLGPFDSYLGRHENVFPLESGTSFYRQILPDNSLTLGFSATAMHWLSSKPCDINNHVHMVGASGDELDAFRAQAKKDWQQILLCRARELKAGGRLVLINFGIDEQGRYLGNTVGVNMFNTFHEIWQEMMTAGRISEAEYAAMTLPQYYNTVEEFSAPLLNENDPVHQAGLRLESIETRVVPCPFAEDFKQHRDAEKFATDYIPTIRTWNESTYFAGLSSERPLEERKRVIEDFYGAYRMRVVADPDQHGMGYVHAYTVISKCRE